MAGNTLTVTLCLLIVLIFPEANSKLNLAKSLLSIAKKTASMDIDTTKAILHGPRVASSTVGVGKIIYRSGLISSLSQLDRGDKDEAMKTLREAIVSFLVFDIMQTYGLPTMSTVFDKIINKYGRKFPDTISSFNTYNRLISDTIVDQSSLLTKQAAVTRTENILASLDSMKLKIRQTFDKEVTAFLKNTQIYDDMVKSLASAKKWAKAIKWADLLAGPLFDVANVAFSGWQLYHAIQTNDDLSIASSSLSIAGSVVGIGSFLIGSLAVAGTTLAVVAGPVGIAIACVLSLAALIIDVINLYNPSQKITEHLALVKSLTEASKGMLNVHYDVIKKASENGVSAGFSEMYDVNQAMLVSASKFDSSDKVRGLQYRNDRLIFSPELKFESDEINGYLRIGTLRIFDKKHYANLFFHPSGREEIGHDYYGRAIETDVTDGITVRVKTDMVSNFWINGVNIRTFANGHEDDEHDDNVEIGDFRLLVPDLYKFLLVRTGGGDDLLSISGVLCNQQLAQLLKGQCLTAMMGSGRDTISFEGMDTMLDRRKWFLNNDDLSLVALVIGVKVDFTQSVIMNRIRDNEGIKSDVIVGMMRDVEGFIGSPLDDVVIINDKSDYYIRQCSGYNLYELHIAQTTTVNLTQISIEDNSDTPGKLKIVKSGLTVDNIVYYAGANMLVIFFEHNRNSRVIQIILKRFKPNLGRFRVQVNSGRTKFLSTFERFGLQQDVLLPYVPYMYTFDKDLVTRLDAVTYLELYPPSGEYPMATKTFSIELKSLASYLFLSQELIEAIPKRDYNLIAKRTGNKYSDNHWSLSLQTSLETGGWNVSIGQSGYICTGVPGGEEILIYLAEDERDEIDIYREYVTIKSENSFDFSSSFNGSDFAEKLFMKSPPFKDFTNKQFVIDLKGPISPSRSHRNEIVFPTRVILLLFRFVLENYVGYVIERADVSSEWHLKVYSYWHKPKRLVYDVILLNVHAFVCEGQRYHWHEILDLTQSHETKHDLVRILRSIYQSYNA